MQTLPLPIQPAAPVPQRANASNGAAPNTDTAAFTAALTREVAQRQQAESAAAQGSQQQTAEPAAPAQPSTPESAAAKTTADSDAADDDQGDAAQSAATQVTDMLALVASLTLPSTVAATPAAQPAAAQASAALGLGRGKGAGDAAQLTLLRQADAVLGKDGAAPAGEFFDRLHGLASGVSGAAAARDGAGLRTKAALSTDKASAEAAPALLPARDVAASKELAQTAAQSLAAKAGTQLEASEAAGLKEALAKQASALDAAAATPVPAPAVATPLQVVQAAGVLPDHIAARVGTQAWDQQLGQKIVWMVAGEEQSASLTLNPPDLGPMQVVLSVTNDQASVAFSSHQPEVRQALQDALPRLREMMSESGIALGNATVDAGMPDGRQAQGGEQPRSSGGAVRFGGGAEQSEVDVRPAARVSTLGGRGAVDTFA
jgi:flagellar hook-length control protein FliK